MCFPMDFISFPNGFHWFSKGFHWFPMEFIVFSIDFIGFPMDLLIPLVSQWISLVPNGFDLFSNGFHGFSNGFHLFPMDFIGCPRKFVFQWISLVIQWISFETHHFRNAPFWSGCRQIHDFKNSRSRFRGFHSLAQLKHLYFSEEFTAYSAQTRCSPRISSPAPTQPLHFRRNSHPPSKTQPAISNNSKNIPRIPRTISRIPSTISRISRIPNTISWFSRNVEVLEWNFWKYAAHNLRNRHPNRPSSSAWSTISCFSRGGRGMGYAPP